MKTAAALVAALLLAPLPASADAPPDAPPAAAEGRGPSAEVLELRNLGLAQLENEQPGEAEETFRQLAQKLPKDPLPWADLAIAQLRQQKGDESLAAIDRALTLAPGRGDLLAIRGEVLQWIGREEDALDVLIEAARASFRDPETVFALYRLSSTLTSPKAESWEAQSLEQLARLRPENVVVLSALGRQAIERGDREAATAAYLRLRELAWQGPEVVGTALGEVLSALEGEEPQAARVPAQRLENVLKVTPMYQQSLRELTLGIQGVPLWRLADELAPAGRGDWGEPAEVRFTGRRLSATPGGSVAIGDFDGDGTPDLARLTVGEKPAVEVHRSGAQEPAAYPVPAGLTTLLVRDVDNDGRLDLLAAGAKDLVALAGREDGSFAPATEPWGLGTAWGRAATALDFDVEGDLDLVLAGPGLALYRNSLQGALAEEGGRVFPELPAEPQAGEIRDVIATDLDRDGDQDLVLARVDGPSGLTVLDNLRQGRFTERTERRGLAGSGGAHAVVSADLDHDGHPELVAASDGGGLAIYRNRSGKLERVRAALPRLPREPFWALAAADFDNDGRLDLAGTSPAGLAVLAARGDRRFELLPVEGAPAGAAGLAAADFDGDGDVDLALSGPAGLHRLTNEGGNDNRWLTVRLRGLDRGNSKNNLFGVGSTVEISAEGLYQFREADGDAVHFGLGSVAEPDVLRVTWTNGVPQNRLRPKTDQTVVEEQVLKGSCPFLYAWNGREYEFVTDLLWGAPAGLPLAPGVWAPADPEEIVHVPTAVAQDGVYRLSVTEELWEAAFFDVARLWVVDHPADAEVASSLKIVPGETVPDVVHATRAARPVARAWDGRGADVTERVAQRDEVYADGYEESRYQGVAAEPWSFTFDLGDAPAAPVRLLLDGWIFPADASLNLAVAQRPDLPYLPPRLEVETDAGWQVLIDSMGHPAGKTKTMVVDTPPLPEGARRLRIVTSLWLHWDRIAWSTEPADADARVVARLTPQAELAFRGFSAPVRVAPNAPHGFDYRTVSTESPWLPFPGRYTRFGDVAELLADPDSRSVVMAPGDEMLLTFDASHLPPPPAGFVRTVFLESHGWDKDADKNTFEAAQVEPLPFRGMSGYPYGPDEHFPDTPLHREYLEEWLTRVVTRGEGGQGDEEGRGRGGR